MKKVKDVLEPKITTPFKGSTKNADSVRGQIRQRYGDEEAERFDPRADCAPYSCWVKQGYIPSKGSKAFKSVTYIETVDEETGETKMFPRTVNLFHKRQVHPLPASYKKQGV